MCDIEQMIERIKKRPGMYLGKEDINVKEVYMYLRGFCAAKSTNQIERELDKWFRTNFSHYVFEWLNKNNKLNQDEFTFIWYKYFDSYDEEGIILFYAACESFFNEYRSKSLKEKYYENE